jgi:CheY-like chemotaxis protein
MARLCRPPRRGLSCSAPAWHGGCPNARETTKPPGEAVQRTKRPLVLIADPVEGTRELLLAVFRGELGWRTIALDDGSKLLLQAREMVTQLIVCELDQRMGMDLDLVKKLRADPVTAGISLLCMTAWAPRLSCEEILAAGADVCLEKPFDLDTLLDHAEALAARAPATAGGVLSRIPAR